MLKNIFTILLIFVTSICRFYGQSNLPYSRFQKQDLDSNLILFKARLLTLSPMGIDDSTNMLNFLQSQKATIINTGYDDYVIINVISRQNHPVVVLNKYGEKSSRFCGEIFNDSNEPCNFVLAYSCITQKFYYIKGFALSEIKKLEFDLSEYIGLKSKKYPLVIYDLFTDKICSDLGIDLMCMLESNNRSKKRKRREYQYCYQVCNQCEKQAYVE